MTKRTKQVLEYTITTRTSSFTFKVGMMFKVTTEKRHYKVVRIAKDGKMWLDSIRDGITKKRTGYNYKAESFKYRIENKEIKAL